MHIPILIFFTINLDEDDTLDDEHDMLSIQLTLTSTLEHSDYPKSPLYSAIVPTVLDIAPLVSFPPSLITFDQDRGGGQHA